MALKFLFLTDDKNNFDIKYNNEKFTRYTEEFSTNFVVDGYEKYILGKENGKTTFKNWYFETIFPNETYPYTAYLVKNEDRQNHKIDIYTEFCLNVDRAVTYNIEGDNGIKIELNKKGDITFLYRDKQVKNVSTYWYGSYNSNYRYWYTEGSTQKIYRFGEYHYNYHYTPFIDGSGRFTYTWKDITITPSETIIFNILISLYSVEILHPPVITNISIPNIFNTGSKIFNVAMNVTDVDKNSNYSIFYCFDNCVSKNETKAYQSNGWITEKIVIPFNEGNHSISIWARDYTGLSSQVFTGNFIVVNNSQTKDWGNLNLHKSMLRVKRRK